MINDQKHLTKGNILVVDDTLPNLRLLSNLLTKQGYKVRAVPNGEMALKTVHAYPPDLILLDINMPGLDGYQVCEKLKADELTNHIPIIFISALDEVLDKVKAFSVGGVDYITKPFQFQEVLVRIENQLTLRRLQSQLEQANSELAEKNIILEERNQELDAFAHTVAHELKNPIGNIVGYSEYLIEYLKEASEAEALHILRRVAQNGKKVSTIIDELLLLASIRTVEGKVEPIDMDDILLQVQERMEKMVSEYEGTIILPHAWPQAQGYAPWIEEVWVNYISNGLKYGGRPPRLELGAKPDGDQMIRFWIRDNGPGLTQKAQKMLFTEFTRLNKKDIQGHGLGLSIVQRIVEKLGGEVGVESEVGYGCLFYFTLPQA